MEENEQRRSGNDGDVAHRRVKLGVTGPQSRPKRRCKLIGGVAAKTHSRLLLVTDWPRLALAARYSCTRLAQDCLTSERQLERFFLRYFKRTTKQWMQGQRMDLALDLIKRGYSTKAAAGDVFYKGACQFCRAFRRYFGHHPQHYAPGPGGRIWSIKSVSAHPIALKASASTSRIDGVTGNNLK